MIQQLPGETFGRARVVEVSRFSTWIGEHSHELVTVALRRQEHNGDAISFSASTQVKRGCRVAVAAFHLAGLNNQSFFRQLDLQGVAPGRQHHAFEMIERARVLGLKGLEL